MPMRNSNVACLNQSWLIIHMHHVLAYQTRVILLESCTVIPRRSRAQHSRIQNCDMFQHSRACASLICEFNSVQTHVSEEIFHHDVYIDYVN